MRAFIGACGLPPRATVAAAAAISSPRSTATAAITSSSVFPLYAAHAALLSCVRWQSQSRPYGRSFGSFGGGGGGRAGGRENFRGGANRGGRGQGGSSSGNSTGAAIRPTPPSLINSTQDGELSIATRVAMRDDSVIMTEILKHMPELTAVSVKSLFSSLNEDVQEALSERHGGLRQFLEQRKQCFTLRPRPEDGVFYVLANPIATKQYATRDMQLKTMREMMGLNAEVETRDQRRQRVGYAKRRGGYSGDGDRGAGGSNYRDSDNSGGGGSSNYRRNSNYNSANGGGGGGGGDRYDGGRSFQGNANNRDDRRRPPPQRGGGSRGPGPRGRDRPMGSRQESFGTRN